MENLLNKFLNNQFSTNCVTEVDAIVKKFGIDDPAVGLAFFIKALSVIYNISEKDLVQSLNVNNPKSEVEPIIKKFGLAEPEKGLIFFINALSDIYKVSTKDLLQNVNSNNPTNEKKLYEFGSPGKQIAEKLWNLDTIKVTNFSKEIKIIKEKNDKEKVNLIYALIGYDGFKEEKHYYKNAKEDNYALKVLRKFYEEFCYNNPQDNVDIVQNTYKLALKLHGGSRIRESLKNVELDENNILQNVDLKVLASIISPIERILLKNQKVEKRKKEEEESDEENVPRKKRTRKQKKVSFTTSKKMKDDDDSDAESDVNKKVNNDAESDAESDGNLSEAMKSDDDSDAESKTD